MSDKEHVEAVIRVVANRCRNLRKVIDRARALEAAEAEGQPLRDEQRDSVRDIGRKEALLAELLEIFKKQTAVVEPPAPEVPKLSRRAAKAARAKARDKGAKSASEKGSEEGERPEKEVEVESGNDGGSERAVDPAVDPPVDPPVGNGDVVALKELEALSTKMEQVEKERNGLVKELSDLKLAQHQQLAEDQKETVREVLNLFHIVDFLRQSGSREALLGYYDNPNAKPALRVLNGLHLDLLCYFNIMLTTPNGNVPHHEAVDVSTAHCLEFLRKSMAQAFEGTSYASLGEIVKVIASCPILTERGELDQSLRLNGGASMASESKNRSNGGALTEPSHIVDDPVADDSLP